MAAAQWKMMKTTMRGTTTVSDRTSRIGSADRHFHTALSIRKLHRHLRGVDADVGDRDATAQMATAALARHHYPKPETTVRAYRVPVQIVPRPGILDPQGAAVAGALRTLGFDSVADVRVGRFVTVDLNADSADSALLAVADMCRKLLANPVIEDFLIGIPTDAGVTPQ